MVVVVLGGCGGCCCCGGDDDDDDDDDDGGGGGGGANFLTWKLKNARFFWNEKKNDEYVRTPFFVGFHIVYFIGV